MGIVFLFLLASYVISCVFAVISVRYLLVKRLLLASVLSIAAAVFLINPAQERKELIPIIIGFPLLICSISIIIKTVKKQPDSIENDRTDEKF